MNIQREHYDIIVGDKLPFLKTIRFIFEGWTDEEERKKYMSDVRFFETESTDGHIQPRVPAARSILQFVCWERKHPIRDGINVPAIGTICDVIYYWKTASPEEIRDYFASHGIAMRPAEPFFKPRKLMTWWQFLMWKIKGSPDLAI